MDIFKDRISAGQELAKELTKYEGKDIVILAIPRGGVPVAFPVAEKLRAPWDIIVPRKIPIPWSPEAGFGAVTVDGTIVLNEPLVKSLQLRPNEIEQEAAKVRKEIERRTRLYRGDKPFPSVSGKIVILIDDGLASGYTMLAAIHSLEKETPKKVVVAVPAASASAVRLIKPQADEFICLIESKQAFFAVADFYEEWTDLTDDDVIKYLRPGSF